MIKIYIIIYNIFSLFEVFNYLINFTCVCRKVLERACVQTLPPRKMKTLFTKFVSFEEKHGTPEAVARVRQMAADYVEKHGKAE